MFRNLLRKIMGQKAATIADGVITGALDAATHGASSRIEDAVKRGDVIGAASEAAPIARKLRKRKP